MWRFWVVDVVLVLLALITSVQAARSLAADWAYGVMSFFLSIASVGLLLFLLFSWALGHTGVVIQ